MEPVVILKPGNNPIGWIPGANTSNRMLPFGSSVKFTYLNGYKCFTT